MLGLLFDSDNAAVTQSRPLRTVRRPTSFSRILAPAGLLLEIIHRLADVAFDDVVAQNHADLLAVGEMFGQRQGVGDAAFAFLIGIIQMLQPEFPPVGEQPQEIAGIPAAGHHQDFLESRHPPGSGSGNKSWACHRSAADVCW